MSVVVDDSDYHDVDEYFYKLNNVHCENDPEKCNEVIHKLENDVDHFKTNDSMLAAELHSLNARLNAVKSEKEYCMKKQDELKKLLALKVNGSSAPAQLYTHSYAPAGHR